MTVNDKRARQLLAELDDAREVQRRTKRAYRYVNTWAPLLFTLGLTTIVTTANLYNGTLVGFGTLAGFLCWILAALCITRCCVSVPRRNPPDGESFMSSRGAELRVREAERAFNEYALEQR